MNYLRKKIKKGKIERFWIMKKKMVLKREIKERLKEDILDLGFIVAGLVFIYLFILVF